MKAFEIAAAASIANSSAGKLTSSQLPIFNDPQSGLLIAPWSEVTEGTPSFLARQMTLPFSGTAAEENGAVTQEEELLLDAPAPALPNWGYLAGLEGLNLHTGRLASGDTPYVVEQLTQIRTTALGQVTKNEAPALADSSYDSLRTTNVNAYWQDAIAEQEAPGLGLHSPAGAEGLAIALVAVYQLSQRRETDSRKQRQHGADSSGARNLTRTI
jgi:hypothetical protein